MSRPIVIEPGMKYYMNYALEKTNLYKKRLYNNIFNGVLFILFVSFITWFLYTSYKNKLSPEEKEEKRRIQTQQIIEKVRSLNNQYSTPNPNVFNDSLNNTTHTINVTSTSSDNYDYINEYSYNKDNIENKLLHDPYRLTDLPPLKFM
jgi:hypothetical protein